MDLKISDLTCPTCGSIPRLISIVYKDGSLHKIPLAQAEQHKVEAVVGGEIVMISIVCYNWHHWSKEVKNDG